MSDKRNPESMPEFDSVMRGLVGVPPDEVPALPSRDRAKSVICEILRLSGGKVSGKTRLYKVFYLAHLFYAKSQPDYLTDWPIVRMPHGPGVDEGDELLREMVIEQTISVYEIEVGPYPSTEFRSKANQTPSGLSLSAIDAIRSAVEFSKGKSAAELSTLTHDHSHSWREAEDGEELDFYVDLLTAAEYRERMASMQRTADASEVRLVAISRNFQEFSWCPLDTTRCAAYNDGMSDAQHTPKTLLEAVRYFSDMDVCHQYMIRIRWPDGIVTCPNCGGDRIGHIHTRRMLQCKTKGCRKQFSTKVGTVFEASPLGLDKWLVAVWCITNAKNGISSHELGRALGVTQKSAWFMLHRIRLAMKTKTFKKITGTTESDETFVGGKARNMHKHIREQKISGRGGVGKAIVHGILERADGENETSRVDVVVVPNQKRSSLQPRIRAIVKKGSRVFTDALKSYEGLGDDYIHEMIDHAKEYVRDGDVHTNSMENFWSLLKEALKGTYVCASPKHLEAYCDEEVLRFNERKLTDGQRFEKTLSQIAGKRLTYEELIGRQAG